MQENIFLAIFKVIENTGTHISSMCLAKSFLIASIDSRKLWLIGCANEIFVSCAIF